MLFIANICLINNNDIFLRHENNDNMKYKLKENDNSGLPQKMNETKLDDCGWIKKVPEEKIDCFYIELVKVMDQLQKWQQTKKCKRR